MLINFVGGCCFFYDIPGSVRTYSYDVELLHCIVVFARLEVEYSP